MNKFFGLLVILFISCDVKESKSVDVSDINVNVTIDRFEQKFYNCTPENLQKLKGTYPFLFPSQTNDSIWILKSNNVEELELLKKSEKVFGDFEAKKNQIEDLFKHIKYYQPTFKEPKIITLITNLDYQNKIMYADSLLFVSLDMYLGAKSEVYQDFPDYLSKNFDEKQLTVDIAQAIGEQFIFYNRNRQFVELMVSEGVKLYQTEMYLPNSTDNQIIGYTDDEISWISANEEQLWKYFIENDLLYSTNPQLKSRFIDTAPFSKFYINIDKESPGRVGVWLGWQIVRSYMKNNNVTLSQLLETKEEEIFKKSKYKPKK
ncbi:MAG: gliding motility lipoprotein GldB [Lutibacter sp.]|nr:gliding motility lipoprotein GldB [Lutibacter sp.]MBP9600664.1 gliding motility lipoprotein GldB [Lutibacter sp.]